MRDIAPRGVRARPQGAGPRRRDAQSHFEKKVEIDRTAQSSAHPFGGGHVAGAAEVRNVRERHGARALGDGEEALVEAVLDLRQRQLVGVVVKRVLNVTCTCNRRPWSASQAMLLLVNWVGAPVPTVLDYGNTNGREAPPRHCERPQSPFLDDGDRLA